MAHKRSLQHKLEVQYSIRNLSALDTDSIGFASKILINTSFPARDTHKNEYKRVNGRSTLHIYSQFGIPFGVKARRIMFYIARQAVTQKSREIFLGSSQAKFLNTLKMQSSGGENGSITSLQNQVKRLLTSNISWSETSDSNFSFKSVTIASEVNMFWDKRNPKKWQTHLTLSEEFYNDLIENSVPIDLRVIDALCYYPFAIDIYCWLTYRYFNLKNIQRIPWESLAGQFGNIFERLINFKRKFEKAITLVSIFYPDAKYQITEDKLILFKSKTHIPRKQARNYYNST